MIKRITIVACVISLVIVVYVCRLAWIQLIPGSSPAVAGAPQSSIGGWQRLSVKQRQRNLVLDTGRGDFYDRHGLAITGETYSAIALFPVRMDLQSKEQDLYELSLILGVTVQQLQQKWDAVREPVFWKADGALAPMRITDAQALQIKKMQIPGLRVLPYRNRYLSAFESKHLIGFTSQHPEWLEVEYAKELVNGKRKLVDQVGGSGLEKSLDMLLHGAGSTSVSYYLDGQNAPLDGLGIRVTQPSNKYYPLKVITTIDLKLQNAIESYVDAEGMQEGAVVVLDAKNADIVAMVSRPQLKPGQFHSSDGKEWANHALKAVAPGSVFKLVTEAAALEAGVTSQHESFYCNGEYGKYGLSCWKEGGHGHVTLKEGLAQSCNIVFATIAERLKAEQFQRTANMLGIGQQVGWHRDQRFGPFSAPLRLLEEEERGQLFAPAKNESFMRVNSGEQDELDAKKRRGKREAKPVAVESGVLAQSGIGQRDVRMSPLQAANLIVTLLNKGRVMEPRLVSEIRYANGQRMVKLPAQRAQAVRGQIKLATAHALLRGMQAVVDHGTGRSIRQGRWAVAGKSGTAETLQAGIARNHQWFAGYGPVKSPRYAIAVLVENKPPGSSHQATKIFRGVMDIAALHSNPKGSKLPK